MAVEQGHLLHLQNKAGNSDHSLNAKCLIKLIFCFLVPHFIRDTILIVSPIGYCCTYFEVNIVNCSIDVPTVS
ncbi:hypothetical protein JD844_031440 [Phrynosoma platyrhinos]|uniref:Uncharacterized protein n=1 Tax=Phrynosoma platyrhinos TaxID=52577 RepID=A0ABQ7T159_PHRPL|nr:hypothetical protein JD844_031440 [Phrynosoma platyrhinos]